MKKTQFISFLFILLTLGFTSCKNDDPERANAFTFDGNTLTLEKAYFDGYGNGRGYIQFQNGAYTDANGYSTAITHLIEFEYETSNTEGVIQPGTYTFNNEGGLNTFYSASVSRNIVVNPANGFNWNTSVTYNNDNGGTVTVSKEGNIYTFDFTINFSDGKVATGFYKGIIEERAFVS
jgi:hypothetical protein